MSNSQQRHSHAERVMTRRLDEQAVPLARSILIQLATPLSFRLVRLLDECRWGEFLASCSIDPHRYSNADHFSRDYLAVSLLSKYPAFELGRDLVCEAQAAFLLRERECRAVSVRLRENVRLSSFLSEKTLYSVFNTARGKIRSLLGPFSWDEAEGLFAFGPGATYTRKHVEGDSYYKYKAKPCVTHGCAILAYTALRRVPAWFRHVARLGGHTPEEVDGMDLSQKIQTLFTIVPGNRVTFVPKTATKLRTIAIEPTMNGYIQHGIGAIIARRLRRGGVDIRDQSKNQRMAEEGSRDGSLSTLDLSAASDSVTLELCRQLLPQDWFDAICATRCEVGSLPDGTVVEYSKVSSMGNGYTFPLESLIFWGLLQAVQSLFGSGDRRFAVYGDDLIVPTELTHSLSWVLAACGFSLNREKSFYSGPFRESCGKHYFNGCDVTPFYIRKGVDTVPRLIWLANQIRRWSRAFWGLDSRLRPVYESIRAQLPSGLRRPSIPDGFGDYALFGDLDEALPRRDPDTGNWIVEAWAPVLKTRAFSDEPFLIRQLSSSSSIAVDDWAESVRIARAGGWFAKAVRFLDSSFRVIPRKRVEVWRRCEAATSNWPSYGPWT